MIVHKYMYKYPPLIYSNAMLTCLRIHRQTHTNNIRTDYGYVVAQPVMTI